MNCPACGHPESGHDYSIPGCVKRIPCVKCDGGMCEWNLRREPK